MKALILSLLSLIVLSCQPDGCEPITMVEYVYVRDTVYVPTEVEVTYELDAHGELLQELMEISTFDGRQTTLETKN